MHKINIKHLFFFGFLFNVCFDLVAQHDEFIDGNFQDPIWIGDTLKFLQNNGELRSNSMIENDIFDKDKL